MLDLLLAGGTLSLPILFLPLEWAENPRIQPWLERFLIGVTAIWCVYFLIVANDVVHGT